MITIDQLLTGKPKNSSRISVETVMRQRLAATMALQILQAYPHRKIPKEWGLYNNLRGVLLADEVGGGKTFEALAVITKALLEKARSPKSRFRVLIIAAPSIRSKWEWRQEEKPEDWCDLRKFIEQTRLPPSKRAILNKFIQTAQGDHMIRNKRQWKNISGMRQGIWICSFGSLPSTRGKQREVKFKKDQEIWFPHGFFDYIIADEAHIVRSGYRHTEDDFSPRLSNSAIRKIYAIQNENPSAKLLLLTATPFQNNLNEFIHMLSLVERSNSRPFSLVSVISAGLESLNRQVDQIKVGGITLESVKRLVNSFDNDVENLAEELKGHAKRPASIRGNGRQNGLDDFLRDIMIRNNKELLEIGTERCFLDDTEKLQYLLMRDIVTRKGEEEKDMFSVKLSQLVSSDKAFTAGLGKSKRARYESIMQLFSKRNLLFEKKFEHLVKLIKEHRFDLDRNVVVVFCRFIATIDVLEFRLAKLFSNASIRRMDGTHTKVTRRKVLLEEIRRLNEKASKRLIFLVSQVGNEGLDFDQFSNTVIHFDGHYNPAVIDQRNGRVYRRDNLNRQITAVQLCLAETYDERIKFIELEKRKLKNFYLGDSSLDKLFQSVFKTQNLKDEKLLLAELEKIRFDLSPKAKFLLPAYQKLIKT